MSPLLEKRRREDPRRRATELAFVRATEDLLNEGASFADLNVSRIADRARRPRTAFYAHFADRRDLLIRLVEEVAGDAFGAIEPVLAGSTDRAELQNTVEQVLATFAEHRVVVRAIVEAAGYDGEVARFWSGVVGRFADAARDRLVAEGHPVERAQALSVALAWMTERACGQQVAQAAGAVADEALVDALTETWWRALAP